jgi:hypothetical protein
MNVVKLPIPVSIRPVIICHKDLPKVLLIEGMLEAKVLKVETVTLNKFLIHVETTRFQRNDLHRQGVVYLEEGHTIADVISYFRMN